MSGISPYRKFFDTLFLPIVMGMILVTSLISDGLTWFTFTMFGLFCMSATIIFNEWVLDKAIEKYRHAIDDGLVMFEGSVWAKAYYKMGTPKARLEREIRRRERAGA